MPRSSDRSFGFVFAAVFGLVALWPILHGGDIRWLALGAGGAFLLVALALPRALAPLNLLWYRFGLLLHRVVSPVALGVIFFGAILPMGLVMRLLRRRPLRLAFEPGAKSYWIAREPPGPETRSMTDPF